MTDWVPGVVIDVSKWQSSLPDLTGVIGVIARAGIGTKRDELFDNHIAAARKAGKWVGSYWFGWGALPVSDQVNAYIAAEQAVGGVSLHALDWESADGFSAAQCTAFMKLYRERSGNPILLYASESRFRDLGQDGNWIANYSQEPTKAYDMWQYGPFRGVDGNHAKQKILDLVGGDMSKFINLNGYDPRSLRKLNVAAGFQWKYLDGSPGGTIGAASSIYILGRLDSNAGDLVGIINTGAPYADKVARLTAVLIQTGSATYAVDICPPAPDAPPADCSAVEAELAAAKATIDEQAAIIAAEKQARLDAENSLQKTYTNIDALKA